MRKKPKIIKVQNGIAVTIEYCCICNNSFHSHKPLDDVGLSYDEICLNCSKYVMIESYDSIITDYLYDLRHDENNERDEYYNNLDENFEDFENWRNF